MIRAFFFTLAMASLPASAGELQISGSHRLLRIAGEPGVTYHPLGIGRPIVAKVVGPAKVELGFRVLVPSTGEGRARVRALINGSEIMTVDLRGAPAGRFQGKHPMAPGPLVSRSLQIGEGSHDLTIETRDGSAIVSVRLSHAPSLDALALAPLTASPLTAAPLEVAPLTPPPPPPDALALEPLTPPAPPPAKPRASSSAQAAATPPAAGQAAAPSAEIESRSSGGSMHLYLLGGAALLGAGAITSYALAGGAHAGYLQTHERASGSDTHRAGILARANGELAWSQGLGIAALALLTGAAVGWSF